MTARVITFPRRLPPEQDLVALLNAFGAGWVPSRVSAPVAGLTPAETAAARQHLRESAELHERAARFAVGVAS